MECAPHPPADGLYLYRFHEHDEPRIIRFSAGRWTEPSGPNRGRTLDRPRFWCAIPTIDAWTGSQAAIPRRP